MQGKKPFTGKVALRHGVVQEASEQVSSADSQRMARPFAFTYSSFPREGPSNLFAKIEFVGGKALSPQGRQRLGPKSCGPAVARAAESFSALLTSSSANAGILTRGTIDTYTLEDFDRMVAINVRAAFVGIQAAAQEMNDGGPDRYHR